MSSFKTQEEKDTDYYNCFKSCYDPGFTDGSDLVNCVNKCSRLYKYHTSCPSSYYHEFKTELKKVYNIHIESIRNEKK